MLDAAPAPAESQGHGADRSPVPLPVGQLRLPRPRRADRQDRDCIDTPDADAILAELARLGWSLDLILNTHWHPDHAGGNAAIKAATGATIVGRPKSPASRRSTARRAATSVECWARRASR
jgi:glyoxylase-like metal-dependent hydrolase (beta-lactamase superfamily II)